MQNILVDWDKQGLSRSLLDGVKVTANFIFKHGIRHKLRSDNPAAEIVIPKRRLTVEEIERTDIQEKYFEEKTIWINKTMDMPNHNMREYALTPPKTKKSIRVIEVDEELLQMLKNTKSANPRPG